MERAKGRDGAINVLHDSLWQAVTDKDIDLVRKLLSKPGGMNVDFTAPDGWVRDAGSGGKSLLHQAAWVGDLSIFALLVEHGADPTKPRARNWPRAKGFTPYHHACFYNRQLIVEYCLDVLGVDVNSIGEDGFTGLHLAAKFGYCSLCIALLGRGARSDIPNRQGKTAREVATSDDCRELLEKVRRGQYQPKCLPAAGKPTVCLIQSAS